MSHDFEEERSEAPEDVAVIDADAAPADAGYRRVHRLTPLLRFWSVILAMITVFVLEVKLEVLGDIYAFFNDGHLGEAKRGTAIAVGGIILLCMNFLVVSGILRGS